MRITSAVIESQNSYKTLALNFSRMYLLHDIIRDLKDSDVIILPAGFFTKRKESKNNIELYAKRIRTILLKYAPQTTVCFGLDFDNSIDQLAAAVSSEGLIALGRKFAPTTSEIGFIRQAATPFDQEYALNRIFKLKGRTFYIAVCYDCFGLRHNDVKNQDVDVILVLSHQFQPRGQENSGDVDFVRKGVAGASQQWRCPAFVTSVFFDREVPDNWPTGVFWEGGARSVKTFKYSENSLHWCDRRKVIGKLENAICTTYEI